MEKIKRINLFQTDFKAFLKDKDNYYIDKSALLKELISIDNSEFVSSLILRPRRFGKSLNQSMIKYFFDNKEAENKYLFDNLAVSKDKDFCDKFQNKFPVLFLTFKDLDGTDSQNMLQRMNERLSQEFERHVDAMEYLKVEEEKEQFCRLCKHRASYADFVQSIFLFTKALFNQYQQKVLVLIDEYDVPLDYAYRNGYFKTFVTTFKSMLHTGLKQNNYCAGTVITGCLQIAKNQIFTGLKNLYINTVANCTDFTTAFGFTKDEVHKMLVSYSLEDKEETIANWYDGYKFNNIDIYNPFSVTSFVKHLIDNRDFEPEDYWANTSGNLILKEMLHSCAENDELKQIFEELANKETIETEYYTTMTYDDMLENLPSIFGVLLFTGYLTLDKEKRLYIPNNEVLSIFKKLVTSFNKERLTAQNPEFVKALLSKDTVEVEDTLEDILQDSISLNDLSDTKEYFVHSLLDGICLATPKSLGWRLSSNKESSVGFPDIIFTNTSQKIVVIIEVKRASEKNQLERLLEEGDKQIDIREYGADYIRKKYQIIKYTICFYKKSVRVKLIT